MAKKRVCLIVRDGWGIGKPDDEYNAVIKAKTPNISKFLKTYPNMVLDPAGEAVGLPAGYQGSSEVGHLNMGAGRIVVQELKRIMDMIEDGSLYETPAFKAAVENATANGSALHLMGLVQDEGVHAHQDHLYAILKHAKRKGVKKAFVHFFADGRDTPPRSAPAYVKMLLERMKEIGLGEIATVTGRYYSMDRSENWNLTDRAYAAIVKAEGPKAPGALEAVENAYSSLKNPDESEITDEYIPPTVIGGYRGLREKDSVIHFNFRQDRAIQLTRAFVEDDYPGKRGEKSNIVYCGLTRYYDSFTRNALPPMNESGNMDNLLGEILSKNGLRQLRISETQKFKHVTSFFNGKRLEPYSLEDRIEIKGSFDPSSFARNPQMNAPEVAERAISDIRSGRYDFILLNFANCDMVGHTGNFNSVIKAVETVDKFTGDVASAAMDKDYAVMITADHGNAEEMWNREINMPKTSHTNNLVEFILAGENPPGLAKRGILSGIAPTVLDMLGLEKPVDMTSMSLLEKR